MTQDNTPPEGRDDSLSAHWTHASVLVVDDEPGMLRSLEKTLAARVGHVRTAGSAEQAEALLQRHRFDLVILDISMPGKSGIALLKELRAQGNTTEAVFITAYADLDTAIEALRAGASDFLLKPFRVTQLLNAVAHSLERMRLRRENWVLKRTLSQRASPVELVGRSIAIKGVQAALTRFAAVPSTVLLTGESGTGKELCALAIHRLSARVAAPFVPVNCATISPTLIERELFGQVGAGGLRQEGLFIYAQGGTLFLDAVGDLPLPMQATLLRVLEDRHIRPLGSEHEVPVDVRIVAATDRPLIDDVEAGRFRKDLYYRLQVVEISLPPLRAHKEDIPDLVAHFVATMAPRLGVPPIEVTPQEMRYLGEYDWPGNVRELRNLIERSLIVGALNVTALYQSLSRAQAGKAQPADLTTDLATLEKQHILRVLESVDGDKSRAAELLGISRRTLERRCAEWLHA